MRGGTAERLSDCGAALADLDNRREVGCLEVTLEGGWNRNCL